MFSEQHIVREFFEFLTGSERPELPPNDNVVVGSVTDNSYYQSNITVDNAKLINARNCLKELKLPENKFVKQVRSPTTLQLDTETRSSLSWLYEYILCNASGAVKEKIVKLAHFHSKVKTYEVFNSLTIVKYMRSLEYAYREELGRDELTTNSKKIVRVFEFKCPVLQYILGIDNLTVSHTELLGRLSSYSELDSSYITKMLLRKLYKLAFKEYLVSQVVSYNKLVEIYICSLLNDTLKLNLVDFASLNRKNIHKIGVYSDNLMKDVQIKLPLFEDMVPLTKQIASSYASKIVMPNKKRDSEEEQDQYNKEIKND